MLREELLLTGEGISRLFIAPKVFFLVLHKGSSCSICLFAEMKQELAMITSQAPDSRAPVIREPQAFLPGRTG